MPQSIPLKTTAIRFVRAVRTFAQSEVGWKAKLIFAALVLLLCASNALNVINSYVGRNFMTAIADRDMPGFVRQAFIYIGVFAALTLVAVIARFGEERLGLLWRDTMTRGILRRYLADGTYQRLNASGTIANPDQRISEDVRAFTVTTLSFALMALNSAFTIVAFSGVLWTISPAPVRRRRALRGDRLALHLRVWTPADQTELRPVGQGSELPLSNSSMSETTLKRSWRRETRARK